MTLFATYWYKHQTNVQHAIYREDIVIDPPWQEFVDSGFLAAHLSRDAEGAWEAGAPVIHS